MTATGRKQPKAGAPGPAVFAPACEGMAINPARYNLRDYGGYRASNGGRLRRGVLLRSGQLDLADDRERGLLARLSVMSIIDMRGPDEIGTAPSPAFEGYSGKILTASSEDNLIPHASKGLVAINTPADVTRQMANVYRKLPDCGRFRESLKNFFRALDDAAREGHWPTLIHCFAGKDRTGLAVGLFHLAAGVHEDDVFADYLMTNRMGDERIEIARPAFEQADGGQSPAWLLGALMAVEADYLAAALARISEEHGGPLAYMAQATGIEAADLHRIAESWIE